jgi:cobalt/nickel transport system permease protein
LLLAAGLGSLVFAAQAINVSVWPGISAHLVGGVLLAWAAGPALGALTMAVVLALQAALLGDGGLAALGANVLSMALLPAGLVALARPWSRATATAGLVAALSVPLAAALIVLETALFRSGGELSGLGSFAARMIGTHLWIGVLEGGITFAAVAALAWRVGGAWHAAHSLPASWRTAAACLAIALLLAIVAFPLASNAPDGYEAAAETSGRASLLSESNAMLPLAASEQLSLILATILTGVLVVTVVQGWLWVTQRTTAGPALDA